MTFMPTPIGLQMLCDGLSKSVTIFDQNGSLCLANQATLDMLKCDYEEISGISFEAFCGRLALAPQTQSRICAGETVEQSGRFGDCRFQRLIVPGSGDGSSSASDLHFVREGEFSDLPFALLIDRNHVSDLSFMAWSA